MNLHSCYTKLEPLFVTNWKPLKFLLSTSLLVAAFGHHNEVSAQVRTKGVDEDTGTIIFPKTLPSLHSYAKSRNSNTEYAVAVMTPTQIKEDEVGILYPSVIWVNCKDGRMRFTSMKKPPAKDAAKALTENMQIMASGFCEFHKREFKHSYW